MNYRRLAAFCLALAMLWSFGGCKGKGGPAGTSSGAVSQPEQDPNWPVKIEDIRVDARPERIVSLSPALTELVCELGGGNRLSGVSDYCDYPKSAESLDRCGTAQIPNRDALKKAAPQVVFTSAKLSESDAVFLQQLGAEVVTLPYADDLDALENLYVTAATVLDGMEDGAANGKKVFGALRERFDALAAAAKTIETPVHGIYLRAAPLMMATGDTLESRLLAEIGIANDAEKFTNWEYPAAEAANLYPELIFYDSAIDPDYFKSTQIYNTTSAYQKGLLYPVNGVAFERQSGRMFEELESMFAKAYPDIAVTAASHKSSSAAPSSEAAADDGLLDISDATKVE